METLTKFVLDDLNDSVSKMRTQTHIVVSYFLIMVLGSHYVPSLSLFCFIMRKVGNLIGKFMKKNALL